MPLLIEFSSIAEMFLGVTEKFAGSAKHAFQRKVDGRYVGTTYDELLGQVEAFALALRARGLSQGDRVGMMSENRLEWVVADFAFACCGFVDVSVFPILTAPQTEYIFNNCQARAVICSNKLQVGKLMKVIDQIPSVEFVIVMNKDAYDSVPEHYRSKAFLFSDMIEQGRKLAAAVPGQLQTLGWGRKADDLLTLIYTSGTTGDPKGVMLTHGNFAANVHGAARVLMVDPTDVVLSYLPLCHSYERTGGYYTCFACGATTAFADSIDTVAENLLEVRPTLMTSVPRLFERIKNRIEKAVPEKNRKIFNWAFRVGRERVRRMQQEKSVGAMLAARNIVADKLVFGKIRDRVGGRMRFFASGGGPLSVEVGEFFLAAGLIIVEGYGLTESSPIISVNPLNRPRLGTVGLPLYNVEVMIAADGEILSRGPHIMKGYYKDPDATAEAIDAEGWLYTGDIGVIGPDGYLKITDRKKNLIVSSGGKNIVPAPIEDLLLQSRLIDQIILVGNNLPYMTALIVPDYEALREVVRTSGIEVGGIRDAGERASLCDHDSAILAVEADVKRLQRDLSGYERVRRFELLPEPFTVENGMMTPTLKVKHKEVQLRYAEAIREMYRGDLD